MQLQDKTRLAYSAIHYHSAANSLFTNDQVTEFANLYRDDFFRYLECARNYTIEPLDPWSIPNFDRTLFFARIIPIFVRMDDFSEDQAIEVFLDASLLNQFLQKMIDDAATENDANMHFFFTNKQKLLAENGEAAMKTITDFTNNFNKIHDFAMAKVMKESRYEY